MIPRKIARQIFFILSSAFFVISCWADNDTVGSDTIISQENFFNFSGINNRIAPGAAMAEGFSLEDGATTVTYDSSLFTAGTLLLNAGALVLAKDVILGSGSEIPVAGSVLGNDHAIVFPCTKKVTIGGAPCARPFTAVIDSEDAGGNVNTIDWSFDEQYVAVGTVAQLGTELRVYSFDGTSLTLTASREFGAIIDTIRWHPSDHYFAVGIDHDVVTLLPDLQIFHFDTGTNALGRSDFRFFPGGNPGVTQNDVEGLAWSPNGDFIAVHVDHASAIQNDAGFAVLGFNTVTGKLSFKASFTLQDAEPEINPLSWSPSGTFIAVGLEGGGGFNSPNTTEDGVRVYAYNGSQTITLESSISIAADVLSVDWDITGSYLAVGLRDVGGISETVRVYEFNMQDKTLTLTADVGESDAVYEVHWSVDGRCLLTGIDSAAATGARNYYFSSESRKLFLVDEFAPAFDLTAFRWSPTNNYMAGGFSNGNTDAVIYGLEMISPLIFNNTHLCFSSDVTVSESLRFEGDCTIWGKGHILDMTPGYTIFIAAGARLCIRNMFIRGIGNNGGEFSFLDNDGQIRLSNVDIELVNTVTTTIGNIYVDGPGTWNIKHHNWIFEQAATLTIDGVTLWKDHLDTPLAQAGTINIGLSEQYLDKLNSGTIKCIVAASDLVQSTQEVGDGQVIIDIPHQNVDTLLSAPQSSDFMIGGMQEKMLTDNLYLAPNRKLRVSLDSVLSGSTRYIHFARTQQPMILIDAGVTFSLENITLKDFTPRHIRYGDDSSRLFFGPGTIIELGDCSDLKALVNGVEQSVTWTFKTDSTKKGVLLKGFGNRLTLPDDNPVSIRIESNATLTLHHIDIRGLGGAQTGPHLLGNKPYNLRLMHPDSRLVLKETTLMLSANYSFSQGIIDVRGDACISGSYTFAYQSPQVSYIRSKARLLLDHDLTFSYDAIPGSASGEETKKKIVFENSSSILHLRGATLHATHTGLLLEKGTLQIEEDTALISQASTFAQSNVLVQSSLDVDVLADATLSIQGLLETR